MDPFLLVSLVMLVAVGVPSLVLFAQTLAALSPRRDSSTEEAAARPRVAVLMPAHDEAGVIGPTLQRLAPELAPGDRLLVVADNCTDHTAALAEAAGAQVVRRYDLERRGKSFALEFGISQLAMDPPDVVVVVDADCEVEPRAIDRLARACAATNRPIQGLYLMRSPERAGLAGQVAAFAWTVKNWVRPLGLRNLGLACQLMGSGTAFPWAAVERFPIANREMAEDYKLGVDLARAGYPALFLPQARVWSEFPERAAASRSQRTRWEHGHLNLTLREAPALILRGMAVGDWHLIALALDLVVPPLSFLALMLGAATFGGIVLALLSGIWWPLLAVLGTDAMFTASIAIAWRGWGRALIPARALAAIPLYVLHKIPIYLRFVTRRQRVWLKTARGADDAVTFPARAAE